MLRKPSALVWYALLLLAAAVLALILPPNPGTLHALHISAGVYRASVLTLILPYAVIWFSAFYAYEKLDQYADKVRRSKEGDAFKRIANGVGVLAWGMAIPTIISVALGAIVAWHPSFAPVRLLLNGYVAMAVSLIGFTIISRGTRHFDEIVKVRPSRVAIQAMILLFTLIGTFYVSLIIHGQETSHNPYPLPIVVLILTLIVPHMYAWFVGLYSAYELRLYAQKTSGVLYKHALGYFTGGFTLVVTAAIAVQYITGAYMNKTNITLGSILLMIYALLAVEAAGYALIALAAKRLKRLEEV